MRLHLRVLLLLVCLSWTAAAQGASSMFLNIPGVPGESSDATHAGEIDVLSWSWGVSAPYAPPAGGLGGQMGRATFKQLLLTKWVDKSSPKLMLANAAGTHYATVVLVVRRGGTNPLEYIKITLTSVLVTSVSNGGAAADDRPAESVSLAFDKVELSYTPQNPDGSAGTPVVFRWDLTTNAPY